MSDEAPAYETADDVRRVNATLDRELLALAADITPDEVHTDPRNGEWTLAENLGHIAEFPRFFAPQIASQLAGDPAPVGRTHENPARLAAIEAARGRGLDDLRSDLATSLGDFAHTLEPLRDDDLARVTENSKYGPESLRQFLDRYVIGHKAAHVRQLRETIAAVRAVEG
jgi:uncharacterized damage-inducible protein DinB